MTIPTLDSLEMRGGLVTTGGEPVPLQGVRLSGSLRGTALDCTLAQRYQNVETSPVEAVYLFPLPAEAAVCGLRVQVGDRVISGEVEEREAAFDQYDQALAQGHGAVLLDQERPNVFQMSVGNIVPGQEAVVEVRLLLWARAEEGGVRLAFPTSLTPRYTPSALPQDQLADVERVTPPYALEVPYGLSLELDVEAGSAIRAVESPSHALRVEVDGCRARVLTSQEQVVLDRALVVLVETAEPRCASALVATHQDRDHVLLELFPDLATAPPLLTQAADPPKHVTFLVDCSGSMYGDGITQARRAVELCLRALSEGDTFEIVRFGSRFSSLTGGVLTYGAATMDQAVGLVRSMNADLGGTEILSALEYLLKDIRPGRAMDLLLLTDGAVSNEDQVLDLAQRNRNRLRIFSFGLGAGASEHLVRGLARATRGEAEMVFPGERMEPKVLSQFGRLGTPVLSDVALEWSGLSVEQAPTETPPLFDGDALRMTARLPEGLRLEDGTTVTLRATTPQGPRQWSVEVRRVEKNGDAVALSWARYALRDLEEGAERPRGSAQAVSRGRKREDQTDDRLVKLSKKYGLLCRDTSFVAVELRVPEDQAQEQAVLRRVPVLVTAGTHGSKGLLAYGGGGMMPGVLPMCGVATPVFLDMQAADGMALPMCPPSPPPHTPTPTATPKASRVTTRSRSPLAAVSSRIKNLFQGGTPASASRQSAAPPPAEPTVPGDPWYLSLLFETRANGSFELGQVLAEAAGRDLADLRKRATELQGAVEEKEPALATALALLLLRRRAADEEATWRAAARKAQTWLDRCGVSPPTGPSTNLQAWVEREILLGDSDR